jgi:hypothetical protein
MYARGTICKVWERSGGGFRTVSVLLRPLMHFSRVEMSSFLMLIEGTNMSSAGIFQPCYLQALLYGSKFLRMY